MVGAGFVLPGPADGVFQITCDGAAFFGAQDAEGGSEGVGGGGVGGDDGTSDAAGEAEAGFRVDDVRVADAVKFDELMEIAGGGNGLVGEADVDGSIVVDAGAKRDCPAWGVRRGIACGGVASGEDDGDGETLGLEKSEHLICGVAFGDATEVEQEAGFGEGQGLIVDVELMPP